MKSNEDKLYYLQPSGIIQDGETYTPSSNDIELTWDELQERMKEPPEEKERNWRDSELSVYVDYFQSKPLRWAELTTNEQGSISDYRIELKNYPELEGFGDESLRPERPLSPKL